MNNQGSNSRIDVGEALPVPAVPFKRQSASREETAKKCRECESPLSDTNPFCWMCGASRDCDFDPRIDPTSTRLALADRYANLAALSPWRFPSENPVTTGDANVEPHAPSTQAAPPEYQVDRTESSSAPTDRPKLEDSEHPNHSRWGIAIVLLLLLAIACLGYWQRDNAKALFGTTAEAAQH